MTESVELLQRWKNGDEAAAEEIFTCYVRRLAGLARNKLSEKMKRRIDAEDVVMSAYRSFFRIAEQRQIELNRSGDLWRLLAAITYNKVMQHVEYHQAAKRTIDAESSTNDFVANLISPDAMIREPSPEEGAALADEVQAFVKQLDPLERQVFELRLEEASSEEIATHIERSPRTVRRILEKIKIKLEERFES